MRIARHWFLMTIITLITCCDTHAQAIFQLDTLPTKNSDSIALLLATKIAGKGIHIVNCSTATPKYSGSAHQIAFFKNAKDVIGLDSGIVLSSGKALGVSKKTGVSNSNSFGLPGNVWLDNYLSLLPNISPTANTRDAAVLSFSFVAEGDVFTLKYVFSSTEYQSYACSNFTDIFAVMMLTGEGVPSNPSHKNIALVPGTNSPLTINTVNDGTKVNLWCPTGSVYPAFYRANQLSVPPTIRYEHLNHAGSTVVMTATFSGLKPCTRYTMLIGIGDVADQIMDSGLFIEAGSFSSSKLDFSRVDSTTTPLVAVEACKPVSVDVRLQDTARWNTKLKLELGGSATNGVDYDLLDSFITFSPGEISKTIVVMPKADSLAEGTESIILKQLVSTCSDCSTFIPPALESDSIIVLIKDSISDHHTYDTVTSTLPITLAGPADAGLPFNSWNWSTGATTQQISVNNYGTYQVIHRYSSIAPGHVSGCYNRDSFIVRAPGVAYTFTGNGDWNDPANWVGGIIPSNPLPPGAQVTITPTNGGSCTYNGTLYISAGAQLIVPQGVNFVVNGNVVMF